MRSEIVSSPSVPIVPGAPTRSAGSLDGASAAEGSLVPALTAPSAGALSVAGSGALGSTTSLIGALIVGATGVVTSPTVPAGAGVEVVLVVPVVAVGASPAKTSWACGRRGRAAGERAGGRGEPQRRLTERRGSADRGR